MDEYGFIAENSDFLDSESVSKIDECASRVYEETGIALQFEYRDGYGVNVWGARFGHPRDVYVMNFGDGSYSSYDGWEYGDDKSEVMYALLRELVASLSSNGQAFPT